MPSDIYTKQQAPLSSSLPYFSGIHDTNYTSSRLMALQHQLHVNTTTGGNYENGSSWSNLIMPYQQTPPHLNMDMVRDGGIASDEDTKISKGREKNDTKTKNPYSIEELLKKPSKRAKPVEITSVGICQPTGVFLDCCSNNSSVDEIQRSPKDEDEYVDVDQDDK